MDGARCKFRKSDGRSLSLSHIADFVAVLVTPLFFAGLKSDGRDGMRKPDLLRLALSNTCLLLTTGPASTSVSASVVEQ